LPDEDESARKQRAVDDVSIDVSSDECVICLDGPATCAAYPCGHLQLCDSCMTKHRGSMKRCAVANCVATDWLRMWGRPRHDALHTSVPAPVASPLASSSSASSTAAVDEMYPLPSAASLVSQTSSKIRKSILGYQKLYGYVSSNRDGVRARIRDIIRLKVKELIRRGYTLDGYLKQVIEITYGIIIEILKDDITAEKKESTIVPLASAPVPDSASHTRTLDHHGRAAPPASSSPPSAIRKIPVHLHVTTESSPKVEHGEVCHLFPYFKTVEALRTALYNALEANNICVWFKLRVGDNTPGDLVQLEQLVDPDRRRVDISLMLDFIGAPEVVLPRAFDALHLTRL